MKALFISSTLHRTSLGRIVLLLRSYLHLKRYSYLRFLGLLFLGGLLSWGFVGDFSFYLGVGTLAWLFHSSSFVNSLVHHSTPIADTMVPASVGEKLLSFVVTQIIFYLGMRFTLVITAFVISLYHSWRIGAGTNISIDAIEMGLYWVPFSGGNGLPFVLVYLVDTLCCIQFRSHAKAKFVAFGVFCVSVFSIGIGMYMISKIYKYPPTLSAEDMELIGDVIFYSLWALCIALAWGIYYRLKTLQMR